MHFMCFYCVNKALKFLIRWIQSFQVVNLEWLFYWDGIIIPNNILAIIIILLNTSLRLFLVTSNSLTFPIFFPHKNIYIFTAKHIRPCIWNTAFLGLMPACHYHLVSLSLINVSLWEPHGTQSCLQSFQETNN